MRPAFRAGRFHPLETRLVVVKQHTHLARNLLNLGAALGRETRMVIAA